MIEPEWAREFAKDWIEAWNSHDLDRILSHYSDDVEVSSPLVVERFDRADGVVSGKHALREYWSPSMSMEPPLEFELLDVLVGLNQLTLYYRSAEGWWRKLCRSMCLVKPLGVSSNGLLLRTKNNNRSLNSTR